MDAAPYRCTCGAPAGWHDAIHLSAGSFDACIDVGLVPLIRALWRAGAETGETCEDYDTDHLDRRTAFLIVAPDTLGLIAAAILEHTDGDEDSILRIIGDRIDDGDQWDTARVGYSQLDVGGGPLKVDVVLHPPIDELDGLTAIVHAWVDKHVDVPLTVTAPYGWGDHPGG